MRKLTSFGAKTNDNTALIQAAIDSRETIWIDPGLWIVDGPLKYDGSMSLFSDGPTVCEIRGTTNLGYRSMFSHRVVWLRYTGIVGAPHTWELDGVPTAVELGTGVHVQCKGIHFRTLSPNNSCFEVYNSALGNNWVNCWFTYKFRGFTSVSAFNSIFDQCRFESKLSNAYWLDDALRVANAWGLSVVGHCSVRDCDFANCVLAMECLGGGNAVIGCRYRECIKGLKLSGIHTHPDLVNTNSVVTSSAFRGLLFKDCLQSLEVVRLGTTELRSILIESYNAPKLDRTFGQPEYGIKNDVAWNAATSASNILIKGSYSVGATTGVSFSQAPEIEP